jgi:pimeloyl-ACP methyl ester carboxylesterase
MVKFLQAGGHEIAYRRISGMADKPVIVFLHEGLGCMKQWKDFPSLLCKATGLPGLMYDRYGYGESEIIREERNPDFLRKEACEILPEILEKLNIEEKIILFGHSDGGTIALFYASCFPERLHSIISVAPHVILEEVSFNGIKSAVKAFHESDLEEKLAKYHGDKTRPMFESWTNLWLSEKVYNWDMAEELKRITTPALIIQGDNDNYGSFRQVETICNLVQGKVHGLYLKNCGHFPHYEHKETILREVSAFIHANYND